MRFTHVALAHCTGSRNNNFNLLRIGAAMAVVLGHSILLNGHLDNSFAWRIGYMAVNCFFVISGFLVCGSLVQRRSLASYVIARSLRIYPALIVVVTLTVLVAGPLFSSLDPGSYFNRFDTWQYLARNSMLFLGEVEYDLPGLFQDNPVTGQVNTPLWTLQYELVMYLGLALIWFVSNRIDAKNQSHDGPAVFRYAVIVITILCTAGFLANITRARPDINAMADLLRFGAMFGAGATCYLLRHRIYLSLPLTGLLLLLIFLCSGIRPLYVAVTWLSLPYILLCLAYLPGGLLRRYNNLGDYSYGVYIIAYPVQQVLVMYYPATPVWLKFILALLICLPLAMASWHFIEKPALRWKKVRGS